jgi:cytochrome c oxidase assembly protein subunit 15
MRHQHAGLAISDFPLAHHQIWPAMDPASIVRYNQERLEVMAANPITAFQVGLQMVHRITAVIVMAAVGWTLLSTQRRLGWKATLTKLALTWVCLIVGQAALGAATIWSNKAADIATAHVAVGALSLMIGAMIVFVARRGLEEVPAVRLAQARMIASRGQDACPTTPPQESHA